jgi:hypothetical protein
VIACEELSNSRSQEVKKWGFLSRGKIWVLRVLTRGGTQYSDAPYAKRAKRKTFPPFPIPLLKWIGESRNDLLRAGALAGSLGFHPARR